MKYNGSTYFYRKDAQGNIAALLDNSGAVVVRYKYDAWGKVLNVINCECCCCDIGNINPFRYRSYYYDVETGLYYLQTRYYDPEVGRFINSDGLRYLGYGVELSNYNLFAYCGNNSINATDATGELPFFLLTAAIGAVAGAIIGGIVAAANGGNVWAGIGIGATAGGLIGAGAGAVASVFLTGSATASTAAVSIGAKAVVSITKSVGISAGLKMLADNAAQAVNNVSQVFWSGGDLAKDAARQVASDVGGKTLEMTRVGSFLEKIDAPYSAWQAASSNFANVASNSSNAIYSIQNASGVNINCIWATIEHPLLQTQEIIYGVVLQSGLIQILPWE